MNHTLKHSLFLAALAMATVWLGQLGQVARAYPKPATVPSIWELKFDYSFPKRITLIPPGAKAPQAFWYMIYTVTNKGADEREFLPDFQLLTRDGQVIRSDRNIPAGVYEAIKQQVRNKYLEPDTKVTGRLLSGEEEAKTSVAIWPEPDPRLDQFSIFVGGLSGEAELFKIVNGDFVKVTSADDLKDPNVKTSVMRKVLQLKFQANGDEPPKLVSEEWIMR